MRAGVTLLALCFSSSVLGLPVLQEALPPLLSEADEVEAALEAAPEHLRADAGVLVLESTGYRRVRDSRNGFTCLVERETATTFEPRCFDAEGSATLLPVIMYRAEQRARGTPRASIDREVALRYRRHEFVAPRRVGICYMLSTRNVVVIDRATDKVQHVGPRLMFYAPNLRGEDLGVTPDLESRLLITDEASESTMIVVPVVSARRTRVNYYSPDNQPLTRSGGMLADSAPRDSLEQPVPRDSCAEPRGDDSKETCSIDDPVLD